MTDIDRTLTLSDIVRELNCTVPEARRILRKFGIRHGDGRSARWYIGEREFRFRQEEGCLPAVMKEEPTDAEERHKELVRARYYKLIKERKCTDCMAPLPPGYFFTRCEACRKFASKSGKANGKNNRTRLYYAKKRKEHRCTCCGEQLPEGNDRTLCPRCAKRNVEREMAYKRRRAEESLKTGKCIDCGRKIDDGNGWFIRCCVCRAKIRKKKAEKLNGKQVV